MERVPSSTSRMKMQRASQGVRHHLFIWLSQTHVFVFWGGRRLNLSLFTLWLRRDESLLLQPQPVIQVPKRVSDPIYVLPLHLKPLWPPTPIWFSSLGLFFLIGSPVLNVSFLCAGCFLIMHNSECSNAAPWLSVRVETAMWLHGNRPRCSSLAPGFSIITISLNISFIFIRFYYRLCFLKIKVLLTMNWRRCTRWPLFI